MNEFMSIANLKVGIKRYLDKDRVEALDNFESYFQSNIICIMTMSFSDYCNTENKGNRKKELLSLIICIFGWLTFLRFFLAAFINDPRIWVLIGDPFYLTGDRILFNLVIASIALNATFMRTLFIIGK